MKNKDYGISMARLLAMLGVIICHFMSSPMINMGALAFLFNVGVQIFLFISGYLYGKRDSIDIIPFYKKV